MINKSKLKTVLGLCVVGGTLTVSVLASAFNCPTCCNTNSEAYGCFTAPNDDDHPACLFDGPAESFSCQNYPGLSFSVLEDGRSVEMDWNGLQPNGNPPANAFVFGFDSSGRIACSKTMSGMVRGSPQSSTLTCPASALQWVYDANQG